jgi:putative DNA primase/helicase
VIGYSLTGVTSAQAFFFLWGVKGSSKSTITECLVEMLGGYAHMLNEYALTGSEQQHTTWIVDLIGKRLLVKDELTVKKINTARLNSMVAGVRQRARKIARDEVDVPITGKIWITTNPRPPMGDGSDGVWRRIHPVHFKNAIAKDDMIPDYGKMLAVEEGAGILRKAVEALWEALEIGEGTITYKSLGTPRSVVADAEDYQEIDDTYGAFFADVIGKSDESEGETWISNVDIMRVHESWCTANRVDTMHPVQLSKALTERGYVRAKPCKAVTVDGKKMTQRGFTGLTINVDGGLTMLWQRLQP